VATSFQHESEPSGSAEGGVVTSAVRSTGRTLPVGIIWLVSVNGT
jgi:hypothetical protein